MKLASDKKNLGYLLAGAVFSLVMLFSFFEFSVQQKEASPCQCTSTQ